VVSGQGKGAPEASGGDREGVALKARAGGGFTVEASLITQVASEPGRAVMSRDESGGWLGVLARRCPALRWRESGLQPGCGTAESPPGHCCLLP
jgi:hypothetical protein